MCGFVALFAPTGSFNADLVIRMRDRLTHRGPDGAGLAIKPCGPLSVGLGHRRLSILDLSDAAAQPMTSSDGTATIVFNGEIYNFIELRDELSREGVAFRTHSDTEVLLAAYRHWGTDCLSHLNGMFAFAIWDEARQELFVARDRFGEKPLFHARLPGGGHAFASEMKALFAHPALAPEVNQKELERFTLGQYLEDTEDTLFAGVQRLAPASALVIDHHGVVARRWRYWIPDYTRVNGPRSMREASEQFLHLFQESIRKRLRSDVPVGTSLSGGLDSSMIVCVLADMRLKGTQFHQNSFSARFDEDPTLSEGDYIDLVAQRAQVQAHAVSPDPVALMEESRRLHWHQEEPFLSASIYLQWCVARLAREHRTTVLLDGQGADELLAGYQFYFPSHQLDLVDQGRWLQLAWTTFRFTSGLRRASLQYADSRRRFNERVALDRQQLQAARRSPPGVSAGPYSIGVPPAQPGMRLRRQIAEALQYNSLPMLLRYADRNAMAFGREGRLPFLDYDLVDWCISLPDSALIQGGWQKYVLRRSGDGILPKQVQWRADKVGYAAPLDVWLRGPLKEWAWQRLDDSTLKSLPHHDVDQLRSLWDQHQRGEGNHSWALWRWISLAEWLQMHRQGIWRDGYDSALAPAAVAA
ncbi:asparagine synthase (glutamine-hydrolyzing) [Ramlibacter rhizophilus]|uniref:asparagine synthase (glutamine-hydrolyzing) n=1 Tax=Ramlibacter rhizophilus TaxID=1781167 RepID=A0A4Z0BK48_9BURK|nr:asparagine synthase (glutamine-hydrolyzing) [Ramlibacter rhizophilus]TFY99676.1 asparagine synthase (glutamine-hydrolyzing) [Ramlibacter rhizophilus]